MRLKQKATGKSREITWTRKRLNGGAEDESGHRKISHGLVRNFRYKLAACRSNSGASRAILEAVANYYWHIIARLWVRLEARKNSPNPPFGAARSSV